MKVYFLPKRPAAGESGSFAAALKALGDGGEDG
jgi:hypothetical protein